MTRVGVVQMQSVPGDSQGNLTRSLAFVADAARRGANIVVLPELCNSGYDLDAGDLPRCAEPLDGPAVQAWTRAAREYGIYVAAGLLEAAGGRFYNAAVLVGPDGPLGAYRKAHLFARETQLYYPGDTGFPVFDTPVGRVGMLICYDLRFPEAVRLLARAGADLICVPTAWVVLSGPETDDRGYCMQAYCAMAHASMNQVVIACADTVGPWRKGRFLGGSLVAGPAGWPLAGPASVDREEILVVGFELEVVRGSRQRNAFNHTWGDRRVDLYALGVEAADLGDWSAAAAHNPHPGITARRLDFGHMTVVRYEFEAGRVFPLHFHPEEQLVVVVSGEMEFQVGGETRRLRAGDAWVAPPGIAHGGRSGAGGSVFYSVLAPRRRTESLSYVTTAGG